MTQDNSPLSRKTIWRDDLSIGDRYLDEEHQRIHEFFRDCRAILKEKKQYDQVERLASIGKSYLLTHFQNEEKVYHRAGWPGAATHDAKHAALTREFESIEQDNSPQSKAEKMVEFLERALLEHLQTEDQKYAAFLDTAPKHGGA